MELFRIQGCVAVSPYWAFLSPCQYLPRLTTDCKSDSHKNRQNNPFLTPFNEEKQTKTQLISTVIHVLFCFFKYEVFELQKRDEGRRWRWQEEMADGEWDSEMEGKRDGKWRLPSGCGSLAMLSSRRQRLNVSVWQAWYDNTHLEETERKRH